MEIGLITQNTPQLIFVVGFPRSGTTFLATQLGLFNNIATTPETRYFREVVDERVALSRRTSLSMLKTEIASNQRLQDMKIDLEKAVSNLTHDPVDRLDGFRELIGEFATSNNCRIVIEKSPVHTYHVLQILDWFPDAKIIGIQRDGRAAMNSLLNTPWAKGAIWRHAADWVSRNKLLLKAQAKAPERVRLVRFEDVMANSDASLVDLATWISGTEVSRKTTVDDDLRAVPKWELEWKGTAGDSANKARSDAWRNSEHTERLKVFEDIAGDTLQELGYDAGKTTFAGRACQMSWGIELKLRALARRLWVILGISDKFSSQAGLQRRLGTKSND